MNLDVGEDVNAMRDPLIQAVVRKSHSRETPLITLSPVSPPTMRTLRYFVLLYCKKSKACFSHFIHFSKNSCSSQSSFPIATSSTTELTVLSPALNEGTRYTVLHLLYKTNYAFEHRGPPSLASTPIYPRFS